MSDTTSDINTLFESLYDVADKNLVDVVLRLHKEHCADISLLPRNLYLAVVEQIMIDVADDKVSIHEILN